MANWDKISRRGNVQDRRAMGGAGIGITGILLVLGLTWLTGGDVVSTLLELGTQELSQNTVSTEEAAQYAGLDDYEDFASLALGSIDDYWNINYSNYRQPTLVLFRGRTNSDCGGASSYSGPHYCPIDQTIYLDETFFQELTDRFGARGGDVAQAYVIAHEVGHHIQNLQGDLSNRNNNEQSIAVELTADCYAGLWAGSIADDGVFEDGEIIEAIDAAAAVGDDNIQNRTQGTINPETWTHGSSVDRKEAFTRGYNNPDNPEICRQ